MRRSRVAFLGLFTAFTMILSFVESQIPTFVAIPGIKLGISNIAIIIILYRYGFKEAAFISLLRVVLTSLLFGTVLSMVYSIAGAILSLAAMVILKKVLSVVTVSVIGGVFHNIGQIAVAILVTETTELIYYLPVLIISGVIAGIVVGLVAGIAVKKIEKIEPLIDSEEVKN
jgi:heptaprenyl diphosphate synthase